MPILFKALSHFITSTRPLKFEFCVILLYLRNFFPSQLYFHFDLNLKNACKLKKRFLLYSNKSYCVHCAICYFIHYSVKKRIKRLYCEIKSQILPRNNKHDRSYSNKGYRELESCCLEGCRISFTSTKFIAWK